MPIASKTASSTAATAARPSPADTGTISASVTANTSEAARTGCSAIAVSTMPPMPSTNPATRSGPVGREGDRESCSDNATASAAALPASMMIR